jgi:exopolysaccharide biosynthesis WecB/TagA/CpsF family protein
LPVKTAYPVTKIFYTCRRPTLSVVLGETIITIRANNSVFKIMRILSVRVDNLKKKEILGKIEDFLSDGKFYQVATINPEFILEAQKDEKFKNILNSCDLNVADGAGIGFAFWRRGEKLKARIAGADLMDEVLKIAERRGLTVFLVANKDGLSSWEETAVMINKIYPDLEINGINTDKNNPSYELRVTSYEIVFCNFGAPFQEKFLHSLKQGNYGLPQHLSNGATKNNTTCYNNDMPSKKNNDVSRERRGGNIKLAMG